MTRTVTCCGDCPFYDSQLLSNRYSPGCGLKQQFIENTNTRPPWCPLPVMVEVKQPIIVVDLSVA